MRDTDAVLTFRKLQDSLLKRNILAKPQAHFCKNVKAIVLPYSNPVLQEASSCNAF